MTQRLFSHFIRCVNCLLVDPRDDLERTRRIMTDSWNRMVARNSSLEQILFSVRKIFAKMVSDLKYGRLRADAKLDTIVTTLFMLIEQSKYRVEGLIAAIEYVSSYCHPLWTKHLERLSKTLILIGDGPRPQYLADVDLEYIPLLTTLTENSDIRLVTVSTEPDCLGEISFVASETDFFTSEVRIRGIYMRPLGSRRGFSFAGMLGDLTRDPSTWGCYSDESSGDESSEEQVTSSTATEYFEVVEYGDDFSKARDVTMPAYIKNILLRMGACAQVKSARSACV